MPGGSTRIPEGGEEIHCRECMHLRTKFLKRKEHQEVIQILSEVFGIATSIQTRSFSVQNGDQSGIETEVDEANDSDSSESSPDENESSHENAEVNDQYAYCGPIVQLMVQNATRNPQLSESLLSLLHLMLVEHITMPYLSRVPGHGEVSQTPSMLSFTKISLNLHSSVACCIQNLVNCTHIGCGHAISLQDDCECNSALRKAVISMQDANPILEAFCVDLSKERRPSSSQFSSMLISLVHLILHHIQITTKFSETLEAQCPEDIREYWEKYSTLEPQDVEGLHPDCVETGIWFPGRKQCRPGITFSSKDARVRNKKYTKSQRYSPGILTLQCACQSPKLLGFIIMTRAESVALVLSSMLTHFPILPRNFYYDNACDMFQSALLRVPWILRHTRMAVDRFHYKSHKCNGLFNPDSYSTLDSHRTETAESINARIEKSLPYMRYLGSENLLTFLRSRLSLINLCALHQQTYNSSDLEDVDLTKFFQNVCPCNCVSCETMELEREMHGKSDRKIEHIGELARAIRVRNNSGEATQGQDNELREIKTNVEGNTQLQV